MSLNTAINNNDILQVKLLLKDARIDVTKADNYGRTPFNLTISIFPLENAKLKGVKQ